MWTNEMERDRGVQYRISDWIRKSGYPKISDRGNCDPNPIRNFRIPELFGSDHRVFRSNSGFSDQITDFSDRVRWIFWRILICIRSENPNFFGYPIRISEILKSDRISEISDRIGEFSDRIFLHTPSEREVMEMLLNVDALMGHYKRWYILMV